MILFATTVFAANAQDKEVQGTSKLMRTDGITHIKSNTSTHFMWVSYGIDGILTNGGAGTYTAKDGKYTETLATTARLQYVGAQAIYDYKVEGKKITVSGFIEKEGEKLMAVNEVREKIDASEVDIETNVQGSWKLVNEEMAANGITHTKLITSTHFMWVLYGPNGLLINGGAGTYTAKDGKYTETLAANPNPLFVGAKAVYDYKVEGDKMTTIGFIEKDGVKLMEINEVWEKVD